MTDGRRHSVDIPISKALVVLRRVRSLRDPCTNSMSKFYSSVDNVNWETNSSNGISLGFIDSYQQDSYGKSHALRPKKAGLYGQREDYTDDYEFSCGLGKSKLNLYENSGSVGSIGTPSIPSTSDALSSQNISLFTQEEADVVDYNDRGCGISCCWSRTPRFRDGIISPDVEGRPLLYRTPDDLALYEHRSLKHNGSEIIAHSETPRSLSQKFRPKSFDELVGQNVVARSKDVKEVDSVRINRRDRVRLLIKNALIPPASSRFKVFIVDECHLLHGETWATVLTSLDNLSQHVIFVMITPYLDKLPRSALARCQRYHFPKIRDADIARRLGRICVEEGLDFDQAALDFIAAKSNGSLRDAEMMLDQLSLLGRKITMSLAYELIGIVSDDELLDLLEMALSSDTSNTVLRARELMSSRIDPMQLISQLANLVMDILVGKGQEGSSEVRRKFSSRHSWESWKHLVSCSREDIKLHKLGMQEDCKDLWNPYGRELQSYANPLHSRIFCKNKGNCLLCLALAELEFCHPEYISKAEKSWKLIVNSLQSTLGCNVEVSINLVHCPSNSKHAKLNKPSFSLFSCSAECKSQLAIERGSESDYSEYASEKPMISDKSVLPSSSHCGSHHMPHDCCGRMEVVRTLRNDEGNVPRTSTSSHRSLGDYMPNSGLCFKEPENQPNCFSRILRLQKKLRSSETTPPHNELSSSIPRKSCSEKLTGANGSSVTEGGLRSSLLEVFPQKGNCAKFDIVMSWKLLEHC
ncbi:hypothetical protein FNV43_RR21405 [Rhamnella rubrinervis]|uniref:Uncharacterized protein n=1 Tax=Rhamnella rubrinervis TaxID=2594499 RepID=A0A8K0GV19_9ROSA|nr:hypothetical protein FNV43_RR21405 [Rhamnella rubrinervis]